VRVVQFRASGPEEALWRTGVLEGDSVRELRYGPAGRTARLLTLDLLSRGALPSEIDDQKRIGLDYGEPINLSDVRLGAPLFPLSIRDFMAFEEHVRNARAQRGGAVPDAWYQIPAFYFSNALAVRGPDEPVSAPPLSTALDFEFEVAVVIGREGIDIPPERAWEHVVGLTVMNDWSARDLQLQEMQVMLGPSKGKDFATSLGPALVTLDELHDRIDGEHLELEMVARVNGKEFSRGNLDAMYHTIPRLIAHASRGVRIHPGEVLGSGTVGNGCLLERGGPYLQVGDVVALEVERLGTLRSPVVAPPSAIGDLPAMEARP
jgi:fumarylacetoacetate (FAA) hydrolase